MVTDYCFDQKQARKNLIRFFKRDKARINSFGKTVNQTFEAHVFAEVIKWYKKNNWYIELKNPRGKGFSLKFSTQGRPDNYTYCVCQKDGVRCQIRHQLRIKTKEQPDNDLMSNICCDIAIIHYQDLSQFTTSDAVENADCISFGEAKHMSAFAELIAGFVGLVHELKKDNLKKTKKRHVRNKNHLAPFLYVSGILYPTAEGVKETIMRRNYDIDIYSHECPMIAKMPVNKRG